MLARLLTVFLLSLLVGCSPPDPAGGPGGPDDGPGGGPDGGPSGGPDAGLPELTWTPGAIREQPVAAGLFAAQSLITGGVGFDQDVGSRIGAMYEALEGTAVKKIGPAFVVVTDPWGPSMTALVGFPVAAETGAESLPEGFTLETLNPGPALAMVFQGPRSTLNIADEALVARAGTPGPGTRIYVLLDRPDQAGPAGPKTKAVLRLSEGAGTP